MAKLRDVRCAMLSHVPIRLAPLVPIVPLIALAMVGLGSLLSAAPPEIPVSRCRNQSTSPAAAAAPRFICRARPGGLISAADHFGSRRPPTFG